MRFVFVDINIIPYRSFYCTAFLRFFQIFYVAFPHGYAEKQHGSVDFGVTESDQQYSQGYFIKVLDFLAEMV